MSQDPVNFRIGLRLPPRIDELPLSEHDYRGSPGEQWRYLDGAMEFDFQNGRILVNKQDLARYIADNAKSLASSYWTTLAKKLENYRRFGVNRAQDPEQLAMFAALIQAFLGKILGRIKKKYDETIDGLHFFFEEGQLLLNGVNVHAFIRLAKKHQHNKKSKIFLRGIKNRLLILLGNRGSNNEYEKIRDVLEDLLAEINHLLGVEVPKLPSGPTLLLKDLKRNRKQ